jgi:hypothetical protein
VFLFFSSKFMCKLYFPELKLRTCTARTGLLVLLSVGDLAFNCSGPSDRNLRVDLEGKALGDLVT